MLIFFTLNMIILFTKYKFKVCSQESWLTFSDANKTKCKMSTPESWEQEM